MVYHFIAWSLAKVEDLNFVLEVNRVVQYLEHVLGKINVNFVHYLVVVENLPQEREELLHVNSFWNDSKEANQESLHLLDDVLNVN